MSFLSAIPIVGNIIDKAAGIIDKAVIDKDERIRLKNNLKKLKLNAESQLLERASQERLAQIAVNQEEAKAKSPMGTWRQGIGWVCVAAFAFNFLINPLFLWGVSVVSVWYPEVKNMAAPPVLSLAEIMPVLLGMLGLGSLRTYEKKNNVHNK